MNEFVKSIASKIKPVTREIGDFTVSITPDVVISGDPKKESYVYATVDVDSAVCQGSRNIKILTLPGSDEKGIIINGTHTYMPSTIEKKFSWLIEEGANGLPVANMYTKGSNKSRLTIRYGSIDNAYNGLIMETAGAKVPLANFLSMIYSAETYTNIQETFKSTHNPYLTALREYATKKCLDIKDLKLVKDFYTKNLDTSKNSPSEMLAYVVAMSDMYDRACDKSFYENSINRTALGNRTFGCRLVDSLVFENGEYRPELDARRIDSNDSRYYVINAGTYVSADNMRLIDKLDEIKVIHDGNVVTSMRNINKYYDGISFLDMLPEIIMALCDKLLFRNRLDNQFDLPARIVKSAEASAIELVDEIYDNIFTNIEKKVAQFSGTQPKISIILGAVIPDRFKPDAFIKSHTLSSSAPVNATDDINILAIESRKASVSNNVKGAAVAESMRKVKPSQAGRLDAMDSAESTTVGLNHYMTVGASIDENNDITNEYYVVNNGVRTDEIVSLTADDELGCYVAPHNVDLSEGSDVVDVDCRIDGDYLTVNRKYVRYQVKDAYADMSLLHACIPFAGNSASKRITMSCNEQRQALQLVKPERPIINAGGESAVDNLTFSIREILNSLDIDYNGKVKLVNVERSTLHKTLTLYLQLGLFDSRSEVIMFSVNSHYQTTKGSLNSYKVIASKTNNSIYDLDDIILCYACASVDDNIVVLDGSDPTVFRSAVAIMKNLRVIYKTHGSTTIDDACVISDRLVKDMELSHIFMKTLSVEVKDITDVIYNVQPGDVITRGTSLLSTWNADGDGTHSIMRYNESSLGYISSVNCSAHKTKSDIFVYEVTYGTIYNIKTGDKLAGRHGNKTTVAKIVPENMMPFDPVTGFRADIILSPIGVPSRQNISQLLEVPFALYMYQQGKKCVVPPYMENGTEIVVKTIEENGLTPKKFYNPETGKMFEHEMSYGMIAMYKLYHIVESKFGAIGLDGKVSLTTGQAKPGGSKGGGQRIGEMEEWCLMAAQLYSGVNEIWGVLSSDAMTRAKLKDVKSANDIYAEKSQDLTGESMNRLSHLAQLTAMAVKKIEDGKRISYMTSADIRSLSSEPIKSTTALHRADTFGQSDPMNDRAKWGYIDLGTDIIHPIFGSKCGVRGSTKVKKLAKFMVYKNVGVNAEGVVRDNPEAYPQEDLVYGHEAAMRYLIRGLKMRPEDIPMVNSWPVLPRFYRPKADFGDHSLDYFYKHVINTVNRCPGDASEISVAVARFLGLGAYLTDEMARRADADRKHKTLKQVFQGKRGDVRSNQMGRRVFSSGRGVISPADIDGVRRGPLFIGLPYRMLVKIYEVECVSILQRIIPAATGFRQSISESIAKKALECLADGDRRGFKGLMHGEAAFDVLDRAIHDFIDGKDVNIVDKDNDVKTIFRSSGRPVVLAGRQPSLHQYSIRAFYPYIADGKSIRIHPIGCKGFNADFDGDQMWTLALQLESSRKEVIERGSIMSATKFTKDESSAITLAQDEVLGMYYMTSAESVDVTACTSVKDFDSLEKMLLGAQIRPSELVRVRYKGTTYINFAGRLLANYYVGGLTDEVGYVNTSYSGRGPLVTSDGDGFKTCKLLFDGVMGDKKSLDVQLETIVAHLLSVHSDREAASRALGKLAAAAFIMSELSGVSISILDYKAAKEGCDVVKHGRDELRKLYERDYSLGLLSDEERSALVKEAYRDK